MGLFGKCSCCEGMMCHFCIQLATIAITFLVGAFVAVKPKKAIEMQIALYRMVNWKLEPISMEREIKNTRVMGALLIIFGISVLALIISRGA